MKKLVRSDSITPDLIKTVFNQFRRALARENYEIYSKIITNLTFSDQELGAFLLLAPKLKF